MKRPAYDKEALRENKGGMQVGQPSADPQQTQETTRTQITPDDISDDGPIAPASANGIPPGSRSNRMSWRSTLR